MIRHWFWHWVGIVTCCRWWESGLTDDEYFAYKTFMKSKGYEGCP